MRWPQPRVGSFTQTFAQQPTKQDNHETIFRLVTALVAFISALLTFASKYSTFAIAVVSLMAIILVAPIVSRSAKKVYRAFQRWQFVRRERASLEGMLRRFLPFVTENQSGSMMSIVHSLCSNHSDAIERILPSNYAAAWVVAFQQQLAFGTSNIHCFMTRCEEFVSIVHNFNRDYVLRTQRAIERGEVVKAHDIDDLERFRDEYNAFLRNVEDWLERLVKGWSAVEHNGQPFGTPFTSHFERLKSFRRSALVKAN